MHLDGYTTTSILILGVFSLTLSKWVLSVIKRMGKSNLMYSEFQHMPSYGKYFTSTYQIAQPMLFTSRKLPKSVLLFELALGLSQLVNPAPILRACFAFTQHAVVTNASVAKHILKSNENLEKSSQIYYFMRSWLRTGLITSYQNIWKIRRKKLRPTLHQKIVDSYFQIFYENSLTLASKLTGLLEQTVDIIPTLGFCTLDIIVETSTGIKMEIQKNEDSEYLRSIYIVSCETMERIYKPWSWFDCIFKLFPDGKKYFKALDYSRNFTMKVIEERKKTLLESKKQIEQERKYDLENESVGSKLRGISFLDMVLEMHLLDKTFSLQDVQDEIETLLLAGHDTTSINMGFALFLLGLDPTRLGKVHEELDAVLGTNPDEPIEMDQLKDLTYLECVIKEAARLYPPVPAIARTLQTDFRIDDLVIPKGTSFDIVVHCVHRDPDVYPDPEKFIPERFLPDAEKTIDPYAFLAFSAGPRSCAGFRFAMLEMKVVLSTILHRFNVESLVHRDKLIMGVGMMQRPINGLPIKFHLR